jgi:hypothetical protein
MKSERNQPGASTKAFILKSGFSPQDWNRQSYILFAFFFDYMFPLMWIVFFYYKVGSPPFTLTNSLWEY